MKDKELKVGQIWELNDTNELVRISQITADNVIYDYYDIIGDDIFTKVRNMILMLSLKTLNLSQMK